MNPHPFDTAIALQPRGDGGWHGHTSAAYGNMIGPFGGITAAQCLQPVLLHPQRLGEPVAFTINFVAALADGPFEVRPRAVRTNRSTQHWTVEMLQRERVVATATAVTALRRETWSGHEARMPEVPRPQDSARAQGRSFEWIQRYDMRFLQGAFPREWDGSERDDSLTRLWVRDDPTRPLDFASLTAMADVFFPRVWLRRARPTPIATVSMSVYYHADAAQLAAAGSGYLLLQAQGQGFGSGYFDQGGQLWHEGGALLATTHQIVYYKE